MKTVISYDVDATKLEKAQLLNPPEIITTEYTIKNVLLAHVKVNKKLALRANKLIGLYNESMAFEESQYFITKPRTKNETRKINREQFDKYMSESIQSDIKISIEYAMRYRYTDKLGNLNKTYIVVMKNGEKLWATIDFENYETRKNFCPPDWLVQKPSHSSTK